MEEVAEKVKDKKKKIHKEPETKKEKKSGAAPKQQKWQQKTQFKGKPFKKERPQ